MSTVLVDLDLFAGRWVLASETLEEPCLECQCPPHNHGLHQIMATTSNGRPAGSGYFLAPCKTHSACPSFRSRLGDLSALA